MKTKRKTKAKKPSKPTTPKINQKTPQTPKIMWKCGSKSENVNFNRYASKNCSRICTVCVVHMDYYNWCDSFRSTKEENLRKAAVQED